MEAISLFVQPKPLLSETIERIVADGTLKARALVLSPGDYLFREGDDMRETFYLTRGLVRLYSGTPDGHTKTVFFHKAGTLIGFQGFRPEVDRKPSILNAKATTKVEAFAIDAERFGSYLKTHGDVCYAMAQYLFEMMSLQTREAVNASVYPVLQRFSALLLTLAREFNSAQAPAIIPFSNEELAEMLGVADLRVLQPSAADAKVGFGVVGELPGAVATVEFMRHIQRTLGVRVVRHSDIASPEVRRVAVCTGAGASMIGEARRAGADIYITADMKYNDFMTPDKALTVADIGHFESEYCAIQILFDILSKNLITFAVRKSEDSRNPVNYLV